MKRLLVVLALGVLCRSTPAAAADASPVVDIPTRSGVTQRVLVLGPEQPTAVVVLFAGGHGGLQITPNGNLTWGAGNFLIRSRQLFISHSLRVVLMDAPSDRQQPPYLSGFRQTAEHVADIKAVVEWLRRQGDAPVWLVGTSRGTQSVAFAATQLAKTEGGPDGIVLTATILTDRRGSRPVPDMRLHRVIVPTLVVHHRQDGCDHCKYADLPKLMDGLAKATRKELLTFDGGRTRAIRVKPWPTTASMGSSPTSWPRSRGG